MIQYKEPMPMVKSFISPVWMEGASPEIGRRASLRKLFLVVFDPEGIKRE